MKYYHCLFLIAFFSSMSLFSQEKFRQHTVSKGETVSEIAMKFNIKPSAIYELNPDAVNGIKYKMILLIPTNTKTNKKVSTSTIATNLAEKLYEVLPKETVYGIAKQFNMSVEELYKINPDLEKEGLKTGQKIKIPQTAQDDFFTKRTIEKSAETLKTTTPKAVLPELNNPKTKVVVSAKSSEKVQISTKEITCEVLPKESLYSIAIKYGITLANLQKANPELGQKSLKVGQKITVPVNADGSNTLITEKSTNSDNPKKEETNKISVLQQPVVEGKKMEVEKTIPMVLQTKADSKKSPTDISHEVLPKQSLFSIAKKYKITLAELKKANSDLGKKSLKVGQKITVPVIAEVDTTLVAERAINLVNPRKKETKETQVLQHPIVENKKIEVEKTISIMSQTKADSKKSPIYISHEVVPKESLYSIAKKYGITLSELKKSNSELGNYSLKLGQKITVPVKSDTNSSLVAEKVTDKKEAKTEKETAITTQVTIEGKTLEIEIAHEVLPKETKYGIAKQYGLTVAELERQNANISKKLLVGSVLKIRASKSIEKEAAVDNSIVTETPSNLDKFENKEPNIARDANFVDQLISKASEHIGTPYRSGGTTTEGFDCSGLMCYTFSSYDIKLPRSSIEMASYGSIIDAQNAQKGDLIFFKTRGSGRINHVGMVVEVLDGEIKFIHSASRGGVIISSTKESYYERNLAQINRVL